jgi:hypothetical protein
MGLYWASYLYFGRLLNKQARERLLQRTTHQTFPPPSIRLRQMCADNWILHANGRFVKLGWIDPVLEQHEIVAGKVARSSLDAYLDKPQWQQTRKDWDAVTQKEIEILDDLIKLAAGEESEGVCAKTFICQLQWSPSDLPRTDGAFVEYNLVVE